MRNITSLLLACLMFVFSNTDAQTLAAGDVAFVGYNTDSPDGFSFIALKAIPAGEKIYFTEDGWDDNTSQWYANSESHLLWTAPGGGLSIGTIVSIVETGTDVFTVSAGTVSLSSGTFNLSGGDNMFAYQSAGVRPASPTFLAGLLGDDNYAHNTGCDNNTTQWFSNCASCASTNIAPCASPPTGVTNSGLPGSLTNGVNAVALFPSSNLEQDNAQYTGSLSGTVSQVRGFINDRSKWSFDNDAFYDLTTGYTAPNITPDAPVCAMTAAITSQTNVSCNSSNGAYGTSDGSLTVTASSGTANYAYTWSNGATTSNSSATTNSISSLSAGTYTVTITDNNLCTATASATVTEPTALVASASVTSALDCNGDNDGQLTASATGGTPGYIYAWNTGGTSATETALAAGTYSITITDSKGCTAAASVTLTEPSALSVTVDVDSNVACNQGADGGITATPSGGTGSYNYTWSNGGITSFIGGLSADTYSVTVTDANGCTASSSNTVTEPAALSTNISVQSDITAEGASDGALSTAVSGGASPFTYLWSNSATTASISGLSAGTYSVTVTDKNSCTASKTFSLSDPVDIIITEIMYNGPEAGTDSTEFIELYNNGGATVQLNGYSLASGITYTFTANDSITAGGYFVLGNSFGNALSNVFGVEANAGFSGGLSNAGESIKLIDALGRTVDSVTYDDNAPWPAGSQAGQADGGGASIILCDLTSDNALGNNWSVSQRAVPGKIINGFQVFANPGAADTCIAPLSTTLTVDSNVSCHGLADGAATGSATGGVLPYTYAWSNGAVTSRISGVAAGTYTLTVTDKKGTTSTASQTITQPAGLVVTSVVDSNESCSGSSNGKVTASSTGGVGGYIYLWSNGGNSASISGLAAGTYTVTVTDNGGCSATASSTVSAPAAFAGTTIFVDSAASGSNSGTSWVNAYTSLGEAFAVAGCNTIDTIKVAKGTYAPDRAMDLQGTINNYSSDINNSFVLVANVKIFGGYPTGGGTRNIEQNPTVLSGNNQSGHVLVSAGPVGSAEVNGFTVRNGGSTSTTNLYVNGHQVYDCSGGGIYASSSSPRLENVIFKNNSVGESGGGYFGYKSSPTLVNVRFENNSARYGGGMANQYRSNANLENVVFKNNSASSDGGGLYAVDTSSISAVATQFYSNSGSQGAAISLDDEAQGTFTNIKVQGNSASYRAAIYQRRSTSILVNALISGNTSGGILFENTNGRLINTTIAGNSGTSIEISSANDTLRVSNSVVYGNANSPSGNLLLTNSLVQGFNTPPAGSISGVTDPLFIQPIASTSSPSLLGDYQVQEGSPLIDAGLNDSISGLATIDVDSATRIFATTVDIGAYESSYCPLVSQITQFSEVSCNGNSDAALALSFQNALGAVTYLWSNGSTNDTVSNLSAGTYSVTVTDNLGCTATSSATVTEPALLTATASVNFNVSCNGSADGSVSVSPTGGTSPYTYLWSNSATTATNASGITAGTYTVTITDNNGCTATSSATVTEPNTLVASTVVDNNISCNGGVNGQATTSATGGTAPYTYAWSNGETTATASSSLSAGTYSVTITDQNGCTATSNATLTEPAALVASATLDSNVSCNGGDDGGLTASAAGGTTPYQYRWSNSAPSASILGIRAGTYSVTITDKNGCTATASRTVTQPSMLVASAVADNHVSCNGGADGRATASATGGTGAYSYLWSNGTTSASTSGLSAGTYTVTTTDANGCTATTSSVITEPTALGVTFNTAIETCPGSNNGTATAVVSGGTSAYSYQWNTGATSASLSNLIAGTYTLTVTDANGCTVANSTTIENYANATFSLSPNESCNVPQTVFFTDLSKNPDLWSWNFGDGSSSTAQNPIHTYTSAGKFIITLTIVDTFKGCTSIYTDSIVISTINASIALDKNVSCNGGADGGLTASGSGGEAPYQYLWSNAATTASITGISAGTYSVTVTDNNGCTATSSATVTQPAALTASTAVNNNVSCNGGANGSADASATGGTTPYSYLWSNGTATASISSGLAAGTYTVTVTDNKGCTATSSTTITEPATLTASTVVDNNVSCNGGTNGGATAGATGGTPNYTYAWSNGATTAGVTGIAAGTYTVTITDANGCTATSAATVTQPATLIASSTVDNNASCNGSSDGGLTASATGGTPNYTYAWSNGATTAGVTGIAAGTYTVTITDANGCTATSAATVTQPATLVASSTVDNNASCNGSSDGGLTASATGGTPNYTYAWSNGATTVGVTGIAAGTYTVTITDANGCTATSAATIMEPGTLTLTTTVDSNESCSGQANGMLSTAASGGTLPYTYLWSTGATATSISGLAAGTYTVTVTDGNNCQTINNATVILQDVIAPVIALKNIDVYLDASGNATISAEDVDSASTDACGIASKSVTPSSFTCANIGNNTVTFTALDISGNSNSGTSTITVIDTIAPNVVTQNVTIYLDASGNATTTANSLNNGSSDACGINNVSLNKSNFDCDDLGANTVILSVTDIYGNTASKTAIVTVRDSIAPVAAAQNLTLYLNANGQASITAAMANNGSTDNCQNSLMYTVSQSVFGCGDEGLNIETLTATDGDGNSATATFLVEVQDTISPTLIAKTITVQLGATGLASISPSQLDSASYDNCANQLFYSATKTSFNCGNLGQNTLGITITDGEGNSTSGTATVIVEDNIDPVARAKNISVQLNANGQATVTPAMLNNGSTDNCSIDSMWVSIEDFNCNHIGQNTVTLNIQDLSGNVNSTNAVVSVQDLIAPSAVAQNITVQLNANGQASISPNDIDNGSNDNCAVSALALDITGFDCSDLGINTVTLTATDPSGNSSTANATVTVEDLIAPSVMTKNITVQLDANGQATINTGDINNGSTDNCSINSLTLDVTSFSCADIGSNTVTLTTIDQSNNSASATATVTIVDALNPVLNTQNITVYLNASGTRTVLPGEVDNGTTDNCTLASTSLDISTFDCADLGQNLVTFTATDAQGNSAGKTTFITVLDTINPSITNLPGTITAYTNANQCATTVQWPTVTASDNCNGSFVNLSHVNGGLFNKGTTTVTVNASDNSGNSITGTFDVVVIDTISPVITGLPTNFNIIPNANTCDAIVNWSAPTAYDNCSAAVLSSSHNPGSTFPVGSTAVTYTATDSDGNTTAVSFTITVADNIAPGINNIPTNIVQVADAGSCSAAVNFTIPAVSDNCTGATLSTSHASGSSFPVGTTTVNFVATDGVGNTSSANFTITVTDSEDPVVVSVPASDTVGSCNAAYVYPLPTGTDNCGPVTITQLSGLPSGNIFPAGVTQNTFKISDAAGNDTVVSFTIVIVPQGQPQLPGVIEICANTPAFDVTLGQDISWSGNGIVNGSSFDPTLAGSGRHTLNYTFTDDNGCQISGSISITVLPAPSTPVIVQLASTTLGTQGSYATYQWFRNGIAIPGATNPSFSYTQGGNYQVMVGNTSGCQVYGTGYIIGVGGTGIGIVERPLADLQVYPNPTSGLLTISLGSEVSRELSVILYSLDGKMVINKKEPTSAAGTLSLDLSKLPKGPYFLRITDQKETAVRKIITY